MLSDILKGANVESQTSEDISILKDKDLQDFDIITLNCVRWSCSQTPGWEQWAYEISPQEQDGILGFLGAGKGLLALHAAPINFDIWPEYQKILGGYWEWGKSVHGPYQPGSHTRTHNLSEMAGFLFI